MTRRSSWQSAGVFAAVIAFAGWHPQAAGAQARRLTGDASDSVPRALAEALIDPIGYTQMMSGGRPRLVVGTLPSALAQRLWLPQGSMVLGGLESSGLSVAVIRSSLAEDSLKNGYRREQLSLGWTAPSPRAQRAIMGFVPSATTSTGDDTGGIFCSGSTTLLVSVTTVDFSTREIRALAMNVQDDRCRSPASVRAPQSPFRTQYPTLVNPPGSGNGFPATGCPNWNSSGGGGTTRLRTTMTMDDVFAHYGKQLTDSGWMQANNETVARSWTHRDSTGALVQLTLTARAQPSSPECIEIQMEVRSRR